MFNLFPTSGTHASLILAGVFATLAAAVSSLRITQSTAPTAQPSRDSGHKNPGEPGFSFHSADYFRYWPERSASIRLSSGGCDMNSSLNDLDLPLMQNAIMLPASCGS